MKILRYILFLCVAVVMVQCNTGQKELSVDDFNFNGPLGSEGAKIERVGKNHFRVTLSHAPQNPGWSNMLQFEITKNAKGNALHLDVVFTGGPHYGFNDYFYSWSYDGIEWKPIHWQSGKKDSIVEDSLIFPEFTEDQVYLGHQVPMSYEDVAEMVTEWAKSPFVTVHTIGQSLGKRDIYRLEITDMKSKESGEIRWSHYFANQHPGEHNAQWRMVGMINWLLSDEGEACCKSSISHFILMTSPDGPSNGWYRVSAQGVDMNRTYRAEGSNQDEQVHEAYLCQSDLEELMSSPYQVTDIWSMHTWPGIVEPILEPGPEMGKKVEDWESLRDIIIANDKDNLIKPLKTREQSGENTWTGGPHRQFGISAFLCEGAGSLYTKEENIQSGIVLMKSIAEYYNLK